MDKAQNPAPLTVEITGIKSAKGKILLALFDNASGFPNNSKKAVRLLDAPAKAGNVTVSFDALPAGTYALAVFHDANGDGKLNTNALGIPREDYGFSNNARGAFSAPSFNDASFKHDGATRLSIAIK